MIFFTKSDLFYNYRWTTNEGDPRLAGEPDDSYFNPEEGFEILYLINSFGIRNKAEVPVIGNKAERMIKSGLPQTIRSQADVMKWLEENWSHY